MLKKFRITGIVQGVGFRPFVYRLAKENNLNGYVYNDSEGVVSLVKGEKESVEEFKKNLISKRCVLIIYNLLGTIKRNA